MMDRQDRIGAMHRQSLQDGWRGTAICSGKGNTLDNKLGPKGLREMR